MVKRTASQILESPLNKEAKLDDFNIWGYFISSRGVITLEEKFYMFGDHEELKGNVIIIALFDLIEGCGEIFFAGIHHDEKNGATFESLCQDGINIKEKKWEKVSLKERFQLQDGMLLQFKRHKEFEIYEFRTANLSQCGCDKITNYDSQGCSTGNLSVVKNKCFLHKYEFIKRLGDGGFGNVHLVRNIYNGQLLAAKISKASLRMEYIAMKELQDVACVVKAREGFHDTKSNNYYLIMDWVKHNSLSTWIQKRSQDDGEILRNIIKCLVPSLKLIHDNGWLHRDIKPDNILVENESPLSLIITDFGLSRRLSSNPSDASGTPLYCAPEVLQKKPQRESADWWSLGQLIFSIYKGACLLRPVKVGLQEILLEIDHRLQIIKDGNEPNINKMIKSGNADVAEFILACLKLDEEERTYNKIIVNIVSFF
ncbi:10866_t:CDS:10 [Funneliformis geosporum]|uniref:16023_t:CDS:1 n=1 Tax=Funneliformis geosporum TaxID=1117311 RepID=A0A9W4SJB5_9GLOM|nr:10866_t:CDS:10 [Funneliformis geosporum]CAI2171166.1 16023_t:CDS:10 [Funneliformis geosporum]